jgi:hypothetical protein
MEIIPTKLVKGQGLAKMIIEKNKKALKMDKEEIPKMVVVVLDELEVHEWYVDIVYYLKS